MTDAKVTDGALSVYQFDEWRVRIIDQDGEPWWVLRDVCEALGIGNSRDVGARLAEDEKGVASIDTLGGPQFVAIVNESGLYEVILRSDKPDAKRFRTWITHEVLPSIRKTGAYAAPGFAIPKTLSEALRLAADLEEKRAVLESKVVADAPKVELAEAIGRCDKNMSVTDCAKHFKLHPKLEVFPFLRARGYLTQFDLPTQAAIEADILAVKENLGQNGTIYKQAVVEIHQLEHWRSWVVRHIKQFHGEEKSA